MAAHEVCQATIGEQLHDLVVSVTFELQQKTNDKTL